MADPSELEAWREVHSKLLIACDLAQEAVDFQRAEQRYWMQEIVANLNEDGQVVPSSVWTRATDIPKKTLSKREIKKLYQNAGVIKRKADDDTVTSNESSAVAKKKRRKKATATPPPTMPEKDSHDTEEEEEADKSIPPDSLNTEEPQKPPSFPYEAQNPLQMMAAVAFDAQRVDESMADEAVSYSKYMPPESGRPSFSSRAGNMATYGTLKDVADDDEDEDAF